MNKILKNSWALFLGMGLIMIAHGYQGSLLGVKVRIFVGIIVGKIVGTSCNQDDYTKLYSDVKHMEKQMSKANIRMCRANNRLEKYSKFVELEMGEFIKYKDRDGTYRSGEKITNSFRKGGNSHIKLRVMGKIEKHIEIDRMIL